MTNERTTTLEKFSDQLRAGTASPFDLWRNLQRVQKQASDSNGKDAPTQLLLQEYCRVQQACAEMRSSQDELRALVQKTMAPPWFLGIFLRLVETSRGRLAEVRCDGAGRLVGFAEDIDPQALELGDLVFLNETRNLLVYKTAGELPGDGGVATVKRLMDNARLCIAEAESEYVVTATPTLMNAAPVAGDRVRWHRPSMLATEKLPAADDSSPFVVEDVPDTPPHQLGGMDRARDRTISRYVKHIAYPDIANKYGVANGNRRLLLDGPPGCGKTLLARVLASAIKTETGRPVRLAIVSGSALYDPYVGQTERNIAALFKVPAGFEGTLAIFIDELDAIGAARGSAGNVHGDRFLNTLLAELEGFFGDRSVVVIAATNRAEILDAALLERFAYRLRVERPNRSAARDIFRIHLPASLPLQPNGEDREQTRNTMLETAVALLFDENADNQVARLQFRDGKTRSVHARELLSGRLIEQIALAARMRGFERHADGGKPGIVVQDMQLAVAEAIGRLGVTLSVSNVHCHLPDLSTSMDVVHVEPVVRQVPAELHVHS